MENIQLNYNSADISIKETIYVYHKKRPENFGVKHSNRNCYGFAFVFSGEIEYDFGYKKETAKAGDLLFLRKGESYTARVSSNTPWEHIVIAFDVWDEKEMEHFPFETVNKISHVKRFEELFCNAYDAFNRGGTTKNLETKALIYQIFSRLLHEKEKQFFNKSKYKGIKDAAEYVESNYKEKISVEMLSDISGYSVSHFSRLFKELYSCAPLEYINEVRINKAKNMLRTEMFSLAEIAEECGFSNVYYFSRIFKQTVGVTPRKY